MSNSFSPWLLKSILILLIKDEDYCEKFFPILNLEHFNHEDKLIYTIARAIWGISELYGDFPSIEVLYEEIFEQKGKNINLFPKPLTQVEIDTLKSFFLEILDTEVNDKKYIEDNTTKILSFFAIHKVILARKQDFQSGTLDIEAFAQEISSASTFAAPVELGVNLYEDIERRTELRVSTEVTPGLIELNIPHFRDKLEEGGLPPGSLAFFLAPTNGGKTSALIQIAHDAAIKGHNVLYISAELSEDMIKRRMDACFTGIPIHNIKKLAGNVRGILTSSPKYVATLKRLQLVTVPIGSFAASDIDVLLQRLKKTGFDTNLLVVDYADNLRSGKKAEAYRLEVGQIYKDLKQIAQKHNLVTWTASQMNDAGSAAAEQKTGVIGIRHVNESRIKIHLADLCIGIARTQEEKENNLTRLVLIKNRLGSGDGSVVQVNTRFDISKIFAEDFGVVSISEISLKTPIEGLEGFSAEEPEVNNVIGKKYLSKYYDPEDTV